MSETIDPTEPEVPVLGGPYGPEGNSADPEDRLYFKASMAWALSAVNGLKDYALGLKEHVQGLVQAEADARTGAVQAEADARASAVQAEATARFDADAAEVTNRNQAINTAIQGEVTARNQAINTATAGLASASSLSGFASTATTSDLQTQINALKARIDAAAIP